MRPGPTLTETVVVLTWLWVLVIATGLLLHM